MGKARSSRFPVCSEETKIDFETLYNERVEKCSHETAFNKEEAKALYDLAIDLPEASRIVEIGVEFGRSTAVLGQVATEREFDFLAIDPFIGEYGEKAKTHVFDKHLGEWGMNFRLSIQKSGDVAFIYPYRINLIHIDGDHDYPAVLEDCEKWLPKVVVGGYACFDDYGHDSLPGVYLATQDYFATRPFWKFIGRYGNKLGVFRKE